MRREAIYALAGRFHIEIDDLDRRALEDAVKAELHFIGEEDPAAAASSSTSSAPKRQAKKAFVPKTEIE